MSRLIKMAHHQRHCAGIAISQAATINSGYLPKSDASRLNMLLKRHTERVRDLEQDMYDEINSRPFDIEEMRDFELMMVVSNLTNFRLNRLAYAGRVLP